MCVLGSTWVMNCWVTPVLESVMHYPTEVRFNSYDLTQNSTSCSFDVHVFTGEKCVSWSSSSWWCVCCCLWWPGRDVVDGQWWRELSFNLLPNCACTEYFMHLFAVSYAQIRTFMGWLAATLIGPHALHLLGSLVMFVMCLLTFIDVVYLLYFVKLYLVQLCQLLLIRWLHYHINNGQSDSPVKKHNWVARLMYWTRTHLC